MEVHTQTAVKRLGSGGSEWLFAQSGLFLHRPHLLLEQGFWNEVEQAATRRYFLIDAETAEVTRYSATYQAHSDHEYLHLLEMHGFSEANLLTGMDPHVNPDPMALTGKLINA